MINLEELKLTGIRSIIAMIVLLLATKNVNINAWLNGKATVLMENGNFNFENLKKTKIPIYKFIEQARLKGYYDISILSYAILETNGEISFLPKEEYQISAPIDFKTDIKKGTKQTFCDELIISGKINYQTLDDINKDENWLKNELKKNGIRSSDKVMLATIDEKNKVKVFEECE